MLHRPVLHSTIRRFRLIIGALLVRILPSFSFFNMPDAPLYLFDPNDVPRFVNFGAHGFFWASLGIICGLVVLPRFWSTRIFALSLYAAWAVVIYTLRLINACVWRNHARYIPIWSDACESICAAAFSHSLTSISRLARATFNWDTSRQLILCDQVFVDLFDAGRDDSHTRSGTSVPFTPPLSVLKYRKAREDQ